MKTQWIVMLSMTVAGCGNGAAKESRASDEKAEPLEHKTEEGLVQFTSEQVKSAKIATGKVEKRRQAGLLSATAELGPAADGVAKVGPRLTGRVLSIKVGVGDRVTKGQVLAMLDSPELGRAKADYVAALAAAQVSRESADREKVLAEKKISSEKDWREAEATATKARAEKDAAEGRLHTMGIADGELGNLQVAGHYSSTIAVMAPIAGTVVERTVTLGQMLEPKDTLFTIMDLTKVWVLIDVYERDIGQVKVGQKVEARVTSYRDKVFDGVVENIAAIVDPKTRAISVRVVLPNPTGELKPGMFAAVELEGTSGEARDRLMVPEAALQRDGDKAIVFVPRSELTYLRRVIRPGRTAGGWTEVEAGLAEGDTVVTSGSFLLKSQLKKGELGGEE